MRHARKLAILVLALYSCLTLGVNFHSHGQDPPMAMHCNLCDFSQVFAENISHSELASVLENAGVVAPASSPSCERDPVHTIRGRSPPLS